MESFLFGAKTEKGIIPKHPRVVLPALEAFLKEHQIDMSVLDETVLTDIEKILSPEDVAKILYELFSSMKNFEETGGDLQTFFSEHRSLQRLMVLGSEMNAR